MIRRAIPSDHPEIFRYASSFIENTAYKKIFDPDYLSDFIDKFLYPHADNIVFLAEGKGMLAGMVAPFNFGFKLIATEIAWWVQPEFRNTGVGRELIYTFEEWAKDEGCSGVVMASLDEGLGRYYEKSGYKLVERTYMKELN